MFTIQVLFSNIFWIAFFLIGFISGTITFRKMAKKCFKYVTTGEFWYSWKGPDGLEHFELGVILFFHYILWPIPAVLWLITVVWDIFAVIFSKSIWVIFKEAIIKVDKMIPKFKIVKDKENKE